MTYEQVVAKWRKRAAYYESLKNDINAQYTAQDLYQEASTLEMCGSIEAYNEQRIQESMAYCV